MAAEQSPPQAARTTKRSRVMTSKSSVSTKLPWRSYDGARHALDHFRTGWRTMPPQAWRQWLIALALGWIGTAGLVLLAVWIGQMLKANGALGWEQPFLDRITTSAPLSLTRALSLDVVADTPIVGAVTFVAAVIYIYRGRPLSAITLVVGVLACTALVFVGWSSWARERPDVVMSGALAPGRNSFPSGHVMHAVVLWGLLGYYWVRSTPRRSERTLAVVLITLLLTLVVVGRVFTGAHWPSDLVAGVLLGVTWLGVLIAAMQRATAIARRAHASDRL